jgi:hypothetical protein
MKSETLIAHWTEFTRKLRWKWIFRDEKSDFNIKFHIPSNAEAPSKQQNPSLEQYIGKTTVLLHKTLQNFPPPSIRHNLDLKSRNLIQRIKANREIVVQLADKNLGTVLMDYTKYNQEAMRQLSDVKTYKKINISVVEAIGPVLEQIEFITNTKPWLFKPQELKFIREKIKPEEVQFPPIYFLPKIHKPVFAGRPIVASHKWITSAVSIWMDSQLQQYVRKIPTILKDSRSLIQNLETMHLENDITFASFDVESLYPSIAHRKGIAALTSLLLENKVKPEVHNTIIFLAHTILQNSYLQYNGEVYHQIKGTAMGTEFAPMYANTFMYQLTKRIIQDKQKVLFYGGFLDDGLLIIKGDPEPIMTAFKELDPDIKFTWSISKTAISFLDLVIFKGPRFAKTGILDLRIHQKQLNMYLYVPFNSFHTEKTQRAIIKGELIRYIRSCSSREDYIQIKRTFYTRLRARGYPPKMLLKPFNSVKYNDRKQFIFGTTNKSSDKQPPTVFTTEYNPLTKKLPLKNIIREFWGYVNQDETLKQIFTPPIIGYKLAPSLKTLLVKSKITPPVPSGTGIDNPNSPNLEQKGN